MAVLIGNEHTYPSPVYRPSLYTWNTLYSHMLQKRLHSTCIQCTLQYGPIKRGYLEVIGVHSTEMEITKNKNSQAIDFLQIFQSIPQGMDFFWKSRTLTKVSRLLVRRFFLSKFLKIRRLVQIFLWIFFVLNVLNDLQKHFCIIG